MAHSKACRTRETGHGRRRVDCLVCTHGFCSPSGFLLNMITGRPTAYGGPDTSDCTPHSHWQTTRSSLHRHARCCRTKRLREGCFERRLAALAASKHAHTTAAASRMLEMQHAGPRARTRTTRIPVASTRYTSTTLYGTRLQGDTYRGTRKSPLLIPKPGTAVRT